MKPYQILICFFFLFTIKNISKQTKEKWSRDAGDDSHRLIHRLLLSDAPPPPSSSSSSSWVPMLLKHYFEYSNQLVVNEERDNTAIVLISFAYLQEEAAAAAASGSSTSGRENPFRRKWINKWNKWKIVEIKVKIWKNGHQVALRGGPPPSFFKCDDKQKTSVSNWHQQINKRFIRLLVACYLCVVNFFGHWDGWKDAGDATRRHNRR